MRAVPWSCILNFFCFATGLAGSLFVEPSAASSIEMGCGSKVWLVVPLLVVAATYMQGCVDAEPLVPGLFIFGDSFFDNGNNNNLLTLVKANYPPYGIDFPSGPTGRFTNGKITADLIARLLGFDALIPPFANTSGSDILKGVNYASGAAGIRNETGKQLGFDISLGLQIINHNVPVSEIGKRLGGVEQAQRYLNKCLYLIYIGNNDYANNYFMPQFYPTSHMYKLDQYAEVLIRQYSQQIKDLESLGARKFALPLGCIPYAVASSGNGCSCVEEQNRAGNIFNAKLKSLVDQLNNNNQFSPDAKFIFVNASALFTLLLQKPQSFGLRFTNNATCCQTNATTGFCVANERPCENRYFGMGFIPHNASKSPSSCSLLIRGQPLVHATCNIYTPLTILPHYDARLRISPN